ncbi:recombinase family protein [Rhodococcoides kyotonense]|uniref:Recombinase zinc beta ribbon domain-containing protein n=1 Tax=Rhodococcoides kyotonense TaxID=398843 RepID=A0A239FKN6_9NOCA|nr:recombinase family protein [Rhodococcus kyotonensis]SNS57466.1 Recombinase zinc beta ribbon domain-containing protein [Rhodococcus kyotonensis]
MSRAYGWNTDGTIVETEAAVLKRVAADVINGKALRPIVRELTDQNILTATGRTWEPITIKRALINPRIIGHKKDTTTGELVGTDIDPILDTREYERLVSILEDPSRKRFASGGRGKKETRTHLLSGLVRCGRCGSKMFPTVASRIDGRRRPQYMCMTQSGCGGITIVADLFEADVTERVLARLTDAPFRRALSNSIATVTEHDVDVELATLATRLEDLGTDYARGLITRTTLHSATAEIEQRTADVKRKKQASDVMVDIERVSGDDVIEWWEDATTRRRHDVAAALIDHITVNPLSEGRRGQSGLDTNRLDYFWRNG